MSVVGIWGPYSTDCEGVVSGKRFSAACM